MQDTIKLLDKNDVAVTVFNAMCMKSTTNIFETFNIDLEGDSTVVNLQVLVNGVEVPAVEYMTSIIAKITDHIQDHAVVLAKQMVLDNIEDLVRDSIRNKLQNIEDLLDDVSSDLSDKLIKQNKGE